MWEYCIYFKICSSYKKKSDSSLIDILEKSAFWIGLDTQESFRILKNLFQELESRKLGYLEQVKALLTRFLVAVVRNCEQHRDFSRNISLTHRVDHNSLIIEEYFLYEYQNLSLKELAARLFLSPRQTQRLLLEYYGKSFHEKKLEARMAAACILLEDKNRSISSISEALGYSSPEQFSAAFKKQYRQTPSAYRQTLMI